MGSVCQRLILKRQEKGPEKGRWLFFIVLLQNQRWPLLLLNLVFLKKCTRDLRTEILKLLHICPHIPAVNTDTLFNLWFGDSDRENTSRPAHLACSTDKRVLSAFVRKTWSVWSPYVPAGLAAQSVTLRLYEQMNEGNRSLNATFVFHLLRLSDSWGSSTHSAWQTYLCMNWFSSKYWQPLAMSLATLRRSTMVRLDGWSWGVRTETEDGSTFLSTSGITDGLDIKHQHEI